MRDRIRRLRGDDSGFTLVETVVAMVLLVGMISAVLVILGAAAGTTGSDRKRIAAANLAAREVEMVRNRFQNDTDMRTVTDDEARAAMYATVGDTTNGYPLPGGTAGDPLVVDGMPYTVQRQVTWLPLGSGASACDGGTLVDHPGLAVHVEVTWPSMAGVSPVVSDTVMTPPKGLVNSSSGFAAVRVLDRDSQPSPSTPVTLLGPSGSFSDTTGPDGCSVFMVADAGTYTASASRLGYVAPDGGATPSQARTVDIGELQGYELYLDHASALQATLAVSGTAPDAGAYGLPQTAPGMTVANSNLQPYGVRSFASGTLLTPGLFPWPEGYTAWSGTCPDADPAGAPSFGTRTATGGGTRGQTDAVTLTLRPLKVVVNPDHAVSFRIVATSTSTGCPGGDATLVLGRGTVSDLGDGTYSDYQAVLRSSLPPGSWSVYLIDDAGTVLSSVAAQSVTLDQNGREVVFP